jgi:hypothetical protein
MSDPTSRPKRQGTRGNWTRLQSGKENMIVLWASDGRQSYPGLGFERGRVDGFGEKQRTQTRLGLVRAMKNSYCGQVMFG